MGLVIGLGNPATAAARFDGGERDKLAGAKGDRIALDVSRLSHSYGPREALRDVSFSIAPGDFTVLLGLNGAGKSTLFSLITRLYAHRSGAMKGFAAAVERDPASALARMGGAFYQPILDVDLTGQQNLRYHSALHGISLRD